MWQRYAQTARRTGVTRQQLENFASAGTVLNERQLEFAAAARAADKEDGPVEIGFGGARGGGKSHAMVAQMAVDDCQRFPKLKCLLLRKQGKSNLENFNDLRNKILTKLPHVFNEYRSTLYFPRVESRIILGHYQTERDIDKYLGLEYDVITVEEATTLTRQKYTDIQTCCRSSKAGWRPRMYSTTNPGGIGHAWYRARFIVPYKAGKQDRTRFIPSLVTDNPWNNQDYVKVLDGMTGWRLRAWRFGDWDIAAGQFFTTFRQDVHVLETPFDPLKAKQWLLALDYGFNHPTVILLGAVCDDGLHIVDEHNERMMLTPQHADAVRAMLARQKLGISRDKPLTLGGINSFVAGTDIFAKERDGNTVADDYRKHGIMWKPASTDRVNGWAEILKLLGDTERGIRPRLFIHRTCQRLIECIPALQHDPNRPEDVLKWDIDEEGNGGDDPADALRYLVATKAKDSVQTKIGGL